jgi:hypothetical protein
VNSISERQIIKTLDFVKPCLRISILLMLITNDSGIPSRVIHDQIASGAPLFLLISRLMSAVADLGLRHLLYDIRDYRYSQLVLDTTATI